MDAKEARLIKHFHEKLTNFSFDEKDVYCLLILLRPHSLKKTPVREFSDFVAHRERERGHIYDYLLSMKAFFNGIETKLGDTFAIKPVYRVQEIHESFNSVFGGLGLAAISDKAARGVILCIISLLQYVKISDRTNQEIGELCLGLDNREIRLFGKFSVTDFSPNTHLQAPVLTVENSFIEIEKDQTVTLGIIEVANDNGSLKVLSDQLRNS